MDSSEMSETGCRDPPHVLILVAGEVHALSLDPSPIRVIVRRLEARRRHQCYRRYEGASRYLSGFVPRLLCIALLLVSSLSLAPEISERLVVDFFPGRAREG